MISAAGIEAGAAMWTHIAAVHVFADGQLVPAYSAENGPDTPL